MKTRKAQSKRSAIKTTAIDSIQHQPTHISNAVLLPSTEPSPRVAPNVDREMLRVKGRPDLTALKKILLKHGGNKLPNDKVLTVNINHSRAIDLITEGIVFSGENAILFPHEFYRNDPEQLSTMIGSDPRAEKWSGFALDADGRWLRHCWIVRKRDKRVIETLPIKASMYFGAQERIPTKHAQAYRGITDIPWINTLLDSQ